MFRVLLLTYALSLTVFTVAIGVFTVATGSSGWLWAGSFLGAYLVLAIGCLFSANEENAPATPWLMLTIGLSLIQIPGYLVFSWPIRKIDLPDVAIGLVCVLGYLAFSLYMLLRREHVSDRPSLPWPAFAALIAGCVLVLLSLFIDTTTTFPGFTRVGVGDTGWGILRGRTPWVTTVINVASKGNDPPTIPWLQHFYVPGGYSVYLLALAASVAIAAWMVIAWPPIRRMHHSRVLPAFVSIFSFCNFWICTDIFWACYSLGVEKLWLAVLATFLWLLGPFLALITLLPIALGREHAPRLRTFLVLQVPVATFNYMEFPLPGLAAVMIGLQLESWACIWWLALITGQNQTELLSGSHDHERRLRPEF
jgi:hypothetical protein